MAGTTYQQAAGSWGTINAIGSPNQFNFAGTNGNVFELFDVSLTEGSVAPPFQLPDYASELMLCQRYFEREDSTENAGRIFAAGLNVSTTATTAYFKYSVRKRAPPTIAFSAGNTFAAMNAAGTLVAGTSIAGISISSNGMTLQLSVASGLVAGNGVTVHSNSVTTAFVHVNARL